MITVNIELAALSVLPEVVHGLSIAEKFMSLKRIPAQIMYTILVHAIMMDRVIKHVHVSNHKISVRNSVIAAVIVRIVFQAVVVRHNVTQNNVHVIWLFVNVIQIYVISVVQINLI